MAVTYNSALTITKLTQLLAPSMTSEPLLTALVNANSLFRTHQPPLVSFAPVHDKTAARARQFTQSIVPSQDALRYQVLHLMLPEYTGNVTVQVEEGRGDAPTVWNTLYGPQLVATVNGVWLAHQHTVPAIAIDQDRLRFTYTPTGTLLASHVLVWPDPDPAAAPIVAPYTQKLSGFWPADDALLNLASGPIHTEMLDRCLRNSIAVLRDRWQVVGSFVQEDVGATARYVAPFATVEAGKWALVGKARALLPYQLAAALGSNDMRPVLRAAAVGTVTAGTTAARLRVVARSASGKESTATFNATGTMQVASSSLKVDLDGSADAGFDLEFYVRCDAGQTVSFRNAVVHWRPGD